MSGGGDAYELLGNTRITFFLSSPLDLFTRKETNEKNTINN